MAVAKALRLTNASIASKFIELYWQQTAPYSNGRSATIAGELAQNNGAQAAVINAIVEFRKQNPTATAQSARSMGGYARRRRDR